MLGIFRILGFVIAGVLASVPITAQAQSVILTVDGSLSSGKSFDFTATQLEALGSATINTSTPWYDGVQTFEGVPLTVLMKAVGATGSKAVFVALNDYLAEIPLSDFSDFGVILALNRNGKSMPVDDKGPLFVIYPFDEHPELKNELYYTRSVWQVRRITIE